MKTKTNKPKTEKRFSVWKYNVRQPILKTMNVEQLKRCFPKHANVRWIVDNATIGENFSLPAFGIRFHRMTNGPRK